MARTQNKAPAKKATSNAVEGALHPGAQRIAQPPLMLQQQTSVFQGPVPHPEILSGYERLVPGTALRMIQMAENESIHRRDLESRTNAANISAQERQITIAEYQSKAVFTSDTYGQIAGIAVSLLCVCGAIFLSFNGHEVVAGGLATIPTAAVIQAFFAKKPASPQSK